MSDLHIPIRPAIYSECLIQYPDACVQRQMNGVEGYIFWDSSSNQLVFYSGASTLFPRNELVVKAIVEFTTALKSVPFRVVYGVWFRHGQSYREIENVMFNPDSVLVPNSPLFFILDCFQNGCDENFRVRNNWLRGIYTQLDYSGQSRIVQFAETQLVENPNELDQFRQEYAQDGDGIIVLNLDTDAYDFSLDKSQDQISRDLNTNECLVANPLLLDDDDNP